MRQLITPLHARPTTHKVPTNERSKIVDKLREHSKTIVAVTAAVNVSLTLLLLQIAVAVRLSERLDEDLFCSFFSGSRSSRVVLVVPRRK